MTGYQETLTDPSYHRQVVVQTAPHIGNTGVNDEDDESGRIWVAGYVVRDPARSPPTGGPRGGLEDRLAAEGVVGISGIDTRALTRHLRERGAMRVGVSSVERGSRRPCIERVRLQPQMLGADLSAEVIDARSRTPCRPRASTGSPSPRWTSGSSATCRGGWPRAGSPRTCCRSTVHTGRPAGRRARRGVLLARARVTRPPPTRRWRWPGTC